jgi:tRNA (guanosine-2'-O-)-methyltransferase
MIRQTLKGKVTEAPRRLRRAESVLRHRTSRVLLVVERPWGNHNVQAVFRTAEAFGIQHVWMVDHPNSQEKLNRSVTKGSYLWLSLRRFDTPALCIAALREGGWQIWSTDLSPGAQEVSGPESLRPFPDRVALVVGRESDGVSTEMLQASDRRLFLPMQGFTESFNLSVATSLMLQRCFDACPELRGAMSESERALIRLEWYQRLAGSKTRLDAFQHWLDHPPEPLDTVRPSEEFRRPRMLKKLQKRLQADSDGQSNA